MARKRMIDPNFWSDDKVIELEIGQRLLFIGMWNFSDDNGVIKYSSKQIKAQIFPADDITHGVLNEWLMRLHELGLILFNKDKSLIKIKGGTNYQKINRPTPSKYEFITESSVSTHGALTTSIIEVNRIEDSIKEKNIKEKKESMNLSNQTDELFDSFYDMYPRKVSKKATTKAFNRLNKKDKQTAIDILPKHIKCWKEKNTEMDFIPHPSTWLNQRKWEDVLDSGTVLSGPDRGDEAYKKTQNMIANLRKNQKGAATPTQIKDILNGKS